MTEAEFHRALIVVLVVGAAVMGAGATALFVVFRKFGTAQAGKPAHVALMLGLIVFILLCAVLLLRVF